MPGRNKDCTSFEINKQLRKRMKTIATVSGKKMIAWLEEKIKEDEIKFGLPPVILEEKSPVPAGGDLPRDS